MKAAGLVRRLLRPLEADGDSSAVESPALDLDNIQGLILRGYRMPLVRHFLLAVESPGAGAQRAARTARERGRSGRPADHHRG